MDFIQIFFSVRVIAFICLDSGCRWWVNREMTTWRRSKNCEAWKLNVTLLWLKRKGSVFLFLIFFFSFLFLLFNISSASLPHVLPTFDLQLREDLERARQTHSGEVEGMRKEVSKLTSELHERDLAIASLSASSSSIKQQLRDEAERSEKKSAELKVS